MTLIIILINSLDINFDINTIRTSDAYNDIIPVIEKTINIKIKFFKLSVLNNFNS